MRPGQLSVHGCPPKAWPQSRVWSRDVDCKEGILPAAMRHREAALCMCYIVSALLDGERCARLMAVEAIEHCTRSIDMRQGHTAGCTVIQRRLQWFHVWSSEQGLRTLGKSICMTPYGLAIVNAEWSCMIMKAIYNLTRAWQLGVTVHVPLSFCLCTAAAVRTLSKALAWQLRNHY